MASNIKFKRSAVQNRVPTTAQLALGELALNTYDGKLYTEINTGSATVVEIGSKLSSLVVDGDNGGGGGDVTFHGTTANRDLVWDHSADRLILKDNTRIQLGDAATDLEMYHSGNEASITNNTGNFLLTNVAGSFFYLRTNNLQITRSDQSKVHAYFTTSAVVLNHDNSARVTTTADGADIGGTGSLKIPVGTTAQRSGSPVAGDLRYNSTTSSFEGYSTDWGDIGAGGIGVGSDASNPRTGIIQNRIGVGFTDLNIVGAGISVTGYGTTVFVDFNEFKPGSFHRTIHNYTATAGQTTFAGLNYEVSEKQIAVYLNGARLSEATYTATSGTTVVLDVGASVGDEVEIVNIHTNSDVDRKVNTYTATAGQTTFTGLSYNSKQELDVYLNGIRLASDDFTATSGSTVVLAVGASVNDIVDIVSTGDGVSFSSTTDASGDRFTFNNLGIGQATTPNALNVTGNSSFVGVTTFTGDVSVANKLSFGDSDSSTTNLATFGAGDDMKIYHSGVNNHINVTGSGILIPQAGQIRVLTNNYSIKNTASSKILFQAINDNQVELYFNGTKRFETTNTGASVTGNLAVSGVLTYDDVTNVDSVGVVTAREGVIIPDNKALSLGNRVVGSTAGDLRLYHDGSNSYIDEIGSGNLFIRNGSDTSIFCQTDGVVKLYHDGSEKLSTTAYGIDVTGTTGTDGLAVSGVSTFSGDISVADKIVHTGDTDTAIRFHANDTVSVETGGSQQLSIGANVNIISGTLTLPDTISHRNDSNTKIRFPADDTISFETAGSERARIHSNGNLLLGTTNSTTVGTVNRNLIVGSTTNAEEVAVTLNVIEGTNNRRVKFFLDDDDGVYGLDTTASTGAAQFVVRHATSEKFRIDSSGQLGIGIASPSSPLHAYHATTNTIAQFQSGDAGAGILLKDNTHYTRLESTNGTFKIDVDAGAQIGSEVISFQISSSEKVRIASDGKMGLGTNSPGSELHVSALGATDEPTIRIASENSSIFLRTAGSSGAFPTGGGGDDGELTYIGGNFRFGIGTASKNLIFFNGSGYTERLRITSDGVITCGHGSATNLHGSTTTGICLNGNGNSGQIIANISNNRALIIGRQTNYGKVIEFFQGTNTNDASINIPAANTLAFETNGSERLRIASDGDVTITGTGDPVLTVTGSGHAQLTLTSTSGTDHCGVNFGDSSDHNAGMIQYTNNGDYMVFHAGGAEKIRLTSSSGLGVNTQAPTTHLQIGDGTVDSLNIIKFGKRVTCSESNLPLIGHHSNNGSACSLALCATSSSGKIHFFTGNGAGGFGASNNAERVVIDAAGQIIVGDGVTARERIHLHYGSSEANHVRFTNSTTGNGATDGLNIGLNAAEQALFWLFEEDDIIFGNNNQERMRIHQSGKISINNTSLSNNAVLHIDTTTTEDMHNVVNRTDYTIFNDAHFTGSDSPTGNRSKIGIRNDMENAITTGTSNTSGARLSLYGIHSSLDTTKAAYASVGGYFYVNNTSDNATTTQTIQGCYGYGRGYGTTPGVNYNIYGGYFLGYRGGNVNAGHCYGIYARAHHTTNGSGKTGDMTAGYFECEFDEENVGTAYGVRAHMDRDAGTITNAYLFYGTYSGDGSFTNRWGIHLADAAKNKLGGDLEITGTFEKGTDNFRIPHPLVGLTTTKDLVHSVIEGPQMDLIYRGKTNLVAGISTVNIDTKAGMTEGTFVALCRDIQCFTSNETGWTNVKGSVTGNKITIIAQDNSCTDTISWMVVGERQDDNAKSATCTDNDGNLIVEPDKKIDDNLKYQAECEKNIYNEDPNQAPDFEE